MFWQILLTAIALFLVIEGLFPFIAPDAYKRMMAQLITKDSKMIRSMGLTSMIIGVVIMVLTHSGIL